MDDYFKEATSLLERMKQICLLSSFFLFMNPYGRRPGDASHKIADVGIHIVFDATKARESLQRVIDAEKGKHPESTRLAEEYLTMLIELENDINKFNKNEK